MAISVKGKLGITLTIVSAMLLGQASSQLARAPVRIVEEPQNTCNEDQFVCKSGACIDIKLACDGRIDCSDQSDETASLCSEPHWFCQNGQFRCDYGACVPENSTCNGVKDCFDNSDELLDECPSSPRKFAFLFQLYNVQSYSNSYLTTMRNRVALASRLLGKSSIANPSATDTRFQPALTISTTIVTPPPTTTPRTTTTSTTTTTTTPRPTTTSTTTTTTTPRPTTTTSTAQFDVYCETPPHSKRSTWKLVSSENVPMEVSVGTRVPVGSKLIHTCRPDHETVRADQPVRTCEASGEWSSFSLICKNRDAMGQSEVYIVEPPPAPPRPTTTSTTTTTTSTTELDVYCETPPPSKRSTWKLVYDESVPMEVSVGTRVPVGSKLIYTCKPEFETFRADRPVRECEASGKWTSFSLICKKKDGMGQSEAYIISEMYNV